MDQLSDRPRIEPNRVGIVNRLAERREQTDQCDDAKDRYVVAGIAPNFERVSQRIFHNELGNGVDDNNRRGLPEAIGLATNQWLRPDARGVGRKMGDLFLGPHMIEAPSTRA
jgi:hypothetical protein